MKTRIPFKGVIAIIGLLLLACGCASHDRHEASGGASPGVSRETGPNLDPQPEMLDTQSTGAHYETEPPRMPY